MNPTAIYSKSGKGVQEASGKTSLLSRPDRAVLSAIDGRATLGDIAQKVGKGWDDAFQKLITQLDKDGFIREVSAGTAPAPAKGAPPAKAAPAAAKPAGKPGGRATEPMDGGTDLDFSSLGTPSTPSKPSAPQPPPQRQAAPPSPPPKPAAPPPPPPKPDAGAAARAKEQQSALQKAREEAEAKAQADRDRIKAEMEAKMRVETEGKLRAEAETKAKADAEAKIRADAEAKAKAVRDAAVKAAVEAKQRAEAESKARQEAERKAKEEIERAKREAEEQARKVREEADRARKAAEEEARKAREEAERVRKEAAERERKVREEAERKAKELEEERRRLEEERKREEQERAARRKREEEEEAERRRKREEEDAAREKEREAKEAARRQEREQEEEARKKQREDEDRSADEERATKRKKREESDAAEQREEEERAAKRKQEREEAARRQQEEEDEQARQEAAKPKAKPKAKEPEKAEAKPAQGSGGTLDSLLADLDSFSTNEENDRKEKEEAERKEKEVAARRAKEDAERREREEAERKEKEEARARKEEEKRKKKEDEEALAKSREKEEQRLKEEEEKRKKEADERERKAKADEVLTAQATRQKVHVGEDTDQVRNRMLGKRAAPGAGPSVVEAPSKYASAPKRSLAKPIAIALVLILVVAFGAVHVMPVSTGDYERAASEALGRQVKIGSASLSLYSGLALHFKDVRVGDDVVIANVTGSPEFDALRGEKKVFSRIDLDGVKATQASLGEALLVKGRGENFALGRLTARRVELAGPLALPKSVELDINFGADGTATSATLRGPDNLVVRMSPKGGTVDFEVTASGFPLPVVSDVTLSDFKMKGEATARGMTINEWSGKLFSGELSGTADLRWGGGWGLDGVITARNVNAAVFAPALLSEGKAEGTGKFSMSGADPSKMGNDSRIEGSFTIGAGVLGSFDLRKAIQSGGKSWNGQTQFSELAGQAVYERGAVSLRGVTISAGTINAGATADIAQSGALSGRIVGDIKGGGRATLNLGGTAKEPQVRN